VQREPVEGANSGPKAEKPAQVAALAERVAINRPPTAEMAVQAVTPRRKDVTISKPPGESRVDRPTDRSRAYSLAYVALFAGAALFATCRALGGRIRGFAR